MVRISAVMFLFTSSTSSNPLDLTSIFGLGNKKKKQQSVKHGEYEVHLH